MRSILLLFIFICVLVFVKLGDCKICESLDIRNNVTEFEKLRNCTVVSGYLQIVLFENVNEGDFENISFPELREITKFLLFYRIRGIKSIGKLFPNLSVIRGIDLFKDYALVIYDMTNLQEIGLHSLSAILRGSVRIEKNPMLCYVETIQWNRLIPESYQPITVTALNHAQNECPNCPDHCPKKQCWNSKYCQITIASHCHSECVKGCEGPRNDQCHVCKNLRDETRCVSTCPKNKYLLAEQALCITREECVSLNDTWWTFNGECINNCPTGYKNHSLKKGGWSCEFCGADCPKICSGIQIEDVTSAQMLRGCTYFNGSLTIRINGPQNIEDELEKSLGMLEEISGYLKVQRSFSLRSLKFLKKLRVIHGNELESKKYSVVVHYNQNLQSLWDWSTVKLQIETGIFSFHYNPELCLSEIEKLRTITGLTKNYTDTDVSPHSNGDKFACSHVYIWTQVDLTGPNSVNLKWNPLDQQSLIGYLIYYIEASYTNISTYDGDVCGDQGWSSIFVPNSNSTKQLNQSIENLEPYTKYGYYISTLYSTGKGSQNNLNYFVTLSSDPLVPTDIKTVPLGSDTLLVTWNKPPKINGILSHYEILTYMIPDDVSYLDTRDYCRNPLQTTKPKISPAEITTLAPLNITDNCNCKKEPILTVLKNEFDTICTTLDKYGDEHDVCSTFSYQTLPYDSHFKYGESSAENMIAKRSDLKPISHDELFFKVMGNETKFNITGLKHYSIYVLLLKACNKNRTEKAQCSSVVMLSQRTGRKSQADTIQSPRINISPHIIDVKWPEPTNPNGVIVSYHIEYRRVDKDNQKYIDNCITRQEHQNSFNQYKIHNLPPGNYSIRIKAQSLAGNGNYTNLVYFYIPEPGSSTTVIHSIIGVLVVVIMLVGIGIYFWYKRKHQLDSVHLITACNPDYVGYVEDEWEMDRDNVKLLQELGQGTFGTVHQGLIKDRQIPCAVKTVHEKADLHDKMEFLNEASVMKAFNDAHHVVRLLGVVSRGFKPLVVMELMARGDLKTFLRSTRDSSTCLTCSEMYRMAAEIADGMAYLSAKKFVHRDLAARNCMVSADHTVKIGDFGMTRDIYETDYYRKETRGLLPVRWMSPESLSDGIFTAESDVWSYGIVLWEIATLSEQPYQGLANEQVLQFVIAKGSLERPLQCPDLLYDIMEACWNWRPFQRPSFADIVEKLETHVGQDFKLVSFYHSREGEEFRLVKREVRELKNQGANMLFQSPVTAMPAHSNRNVSAHWNKDQDDCSFYMSSPKSPGPSSSYQSSNGFMPYPLSSA